MLHVLHFIIPVAYIQQPHEHCSNKILAQMKAKVKLVNMTVTVLVICKITAIIFLQVARCITCY